MTGVDAGQGMAAEGQDALVIVYATFPTLAVAEAIGTAVLDRRLAGCINILPVMVALYTWKGTRQRGEECVGLFKTRAALADAVVAAIASQHPDATPAVLILPISGGLPDYFAWLRSQTAKPDPEPAA